MPSRTYIQMILKLHKNGKIYLPKASLKELRKCNSVLESHPEAIEEIVQRRVDMVAYAKTIRPAIDISSTLLGAIFEESILNYMFLAELIEPPVFDDFDLSPNLHRIAMGWQPVMSNAIVKIDLGGKDE